MKLNFFDSARLILFLKGLVNSISVRFYVIWKIILQFKKKMEKKREKIVRGFSNLAYAQGGDDKLWGKAVLFMAGLLFNMLNWHWPTSSIVWNNLLDWIIDLGNPLLHWWFISSYCRSNRFAVSIDVRVNRLYSNRLLDPFRELFKCYCSWTKASTAIYGILLV